jgi:hypothetical protein
MKDIILLAKNLIILKQKLGYKMTIKFKNKLS